MEELKVVWAFLAILGAAVALSGGGIVWYQKREFDSMKESNSNHRKEVKAVAEDALERVKVLEKAHQECILNVARNMVTKADMQKWMDFVQAKADVDNVDELYGITRQHGERLARLEGKG